MIGRADPLPSPLRNQPHHAVPCLGIFAKAPEPGKVKTRLSPPLSLSECVAFHEAALRDTVTTFQAVVPVLFSAGEENYFRMNYPQLTVVAQGEGDLGERMARALAWLCDRGADRAVLIGSDCPELPHVAVEEAYAKLARADVVAAPARDGGYVLIGVRGRHPGIFGNVAWSTSAVMEQTRERCREGGLTLVEIGIWEDVDDYAGLMRLANRSPHLASGQLARLLVGRYGRGESSPSR